MAYDLHAIHSDILSHVKSELSQFEFYRNAVPEDEELPRDGDEVRPFFVVQTGPVWPRTNGRSLVGPRNDDYFSWIQFIAIAPVEDRAASALAMVTDRLIGYRPAGATGLRPDGGTTDYGSRQYSVRPVLYYQSQRFEFGITQSGLDGYLSA